MSAIRQLSFFPAIALVLCQGVAQDSVTIDVRNPLAIDRHSEAVVVQWSDIERLIPGARPGTVGVHHGKKGIQSQTVDVNLDGSVDEIVFLADLKANASTSYTIGKGKQVSSTPITDARFVLPREDLAWENDRIAFRMYGPALAAEVNNGIDVWTKRVPYPIVEKWYKADEGNTSGKDYYHEDHGEGADFFSVGRSLGCGACALWKNDSLYQPGVFATHTVIATGPLRAIFELSYPEVEYDGKRIGEKMRITLDAGQNLNRVDVTFTGEPAGSEVVFAAGIVRRANTVSSSDAQSCWIALHGLTTDDSTNGYLGTGVIFPPGSCSGVHEMNNQSLLAGKASLGKTVTYYAGAGWSRNGEFSTRDEWEHYLQRFSSKVQSPLVVSIRSDQH